MSFVFFSLKNIAPVKFGNIYKVRTIAKYTTFDSTFSILLLLSHRSDLFGRKKGTFQFDPSSHRKHCSSERHSTKFPWERGRRKLLSISGLWAPSISLKKALCNSVSMTTCSLLIEIYLPSKLFAELFSRNLGKGVPLSSHCVGL